MQGSASNHHNRLGGGSLPWASSISWAAVAIAGVVAAVSGGPLSAEEPVEYAMAIHGGAGSAPQSEQWQAAAKAALTEALTVGTNMLKQGGTSLEAVEAAIRVLEDSPYFNAGKGAVFNAAGTHELDASIMDGRTRACGAVGGVRTIRNPISLARHVMTDTRHILLVADGAEKFARDEVRDTKIELVDNQYFSTPYRLEELKRIQREQQAADGDAMGTVGCVALDKSGNLAAGTSTGGLTNKKYGRVGDSPIVGAGTFADNSTCAVSGTGIGEDFIRNAAAFDVSARMKYRGASLHEAINAVLDLKAQTVRGGLIGVSSVGEISMQFNTPRMARAAANSRGLWEVHAR